MHAQAASCMMAEYCYETKEEGDVHLSLIHGGKEGIQLMRGRITHQH